MTNQQITSIPHVIIQNGIKCRVFRQIIVVFVLLFACGLSIRGQTDDDPASIQLLETDSVTPVIGAVVKVWAEHKESLTFVSDSTGKVYLPEGFIAGSVQIKYLGKELLNAAMQSGRGHQIFYINPRITLNELSVTGYRNLVRRSLMQDVVRIKDVEIFRHENFDGLMSLTPGVLQNDDGYSYFNHPIAGVRFGATGVLKPLTKNLMNRLRSMMAENIDEIRFKKRTSGQGIQYELIFVLNKDSNIALTPSVEAYFGKKGNVDGNVFAQLSKGKFNNTLLLDGEKLNKRKSEYSTYDYGSKNTVVDIADKAAIKDFHLDYNGEFTWNRSFSSGLNINYGTDRTQKNRTSTEALRIRHLLYDPQKFHDLTSSVFLNGSFGNHALHWEASYNRSTSNTLVTVDDVKSQHNEETSLSPNSFLEYTFTNRAKSLTVNTNVAYSYLNTKNDNTLAVTPRERLTEHTLSSGVSACWTKDHLSVNGELQMENNKNKFHRTTTLLPKISVRQEGDKMSVECNYAKAIDRPLAWMLSTNPTIEAGNLSQAGNDRLQPSVKHQIDVTFTYENLIFCVKKMWQNHFADFLADGYDEQGILVKRWQNTGKLHNWCFSAYYNYRRKHFYTNPSISAETGRFHNCDVWESNHFFMAALPLQLMFSDHKISLNLTYLAKSKTFQTTTDGMFLADVRYSVHIPKLHLTATLFARDLFNEKSTEKNRVNTSQYHSSTILHKDKRQFGLTIAYEFFKGTSKEIDGVVNNQNRNK